LNDEGIILVITAPSGSGKTTIYKELLRRRNDIVFSVSYTTRKRRKDEVNGVDYFFISSVEFEKKIDRGEFIEWAHVHGDLKGTEREHLYTCRKKGRVCLLDLDVQGALALMSEFEDAVTVFIEPPNMAELKRRLESRGTESPENMERRLSNAQKELEYRDRFKYILTNDKVDSSVEKLERIIDQELQKRR